MAAELAVVFDFQLQKFHKMPYSGKARHVRCPSLWCVFFIINSSYFSTVFCMSVGPDLPADKLQAVGLLQSLMVAWMCYPYYSQDSI